MMVAFQNDSFNTRMFFIPYPAIVNQYTYSHCHNRPETNLPNASRFYILTALNMSVVMWFETSWNFTGDYERFVRTYSLHIRGWSELRRWIRYVPLKFLTIRCHSSEDHNILSVLWGYATEFLYAFLCTSCTHKTSPRKFLHPTCEVFFKGTLRVLRIPSYGTCLFWMIHIGPMVNSILNIHPSFHLYM